VLKSLRCKDAVQVPP